MLMTSYQLYDDCSALQSDTNLPEGVPSLRPSEKSEGGSGRLAGQSLLAMLLVLDY